MKQIAHSLFLFLLLTIASAQACAYVPDVGEGVCVANCDVPSYSSGSSSSSYSSYNSAYYNAVGQATYTVFNQLGQSIADSWAASAAAQARAAAEARARRQQALDYNNLGNSAFSAGNLDNAITQYEYALQYSPTDAVIQKNLRRARAYRLIGKGTEQHGFGNWDAALDYYNQALEMAPEDREVRKKIRQARARKSQELGAQDEEALLEEMRAANQQLQIELEDLAAGLDSASITAEERAAGLEKMRRLREKGVRFKDDIPVPQPKKDSPPYQIQKDKNSPDWDPYIDAANKGLKKWDETKKAAGKQYQEIKDLIRGEIENLVPGGKLKGLKEDYEDLKKKIGGEHKKTAEGVFGHMRKGVEEAGRPDILGNTDEKVDAFIQERADGYRGMARDVTEEKIKGSIQQLPEGAHHVDSGPQSTTTPILNKKSFARERAAYLNTK